MPVKIKNRTERKKKKTPLRFNIVEAIVSASWYFSRLIKDVKTGIKAVVKAPITIKSKMVLGSRKEAIKTPISETVKLAVSSRYFKSPKIRDAKTATAMTVAADKMFVCLRKSRSVPFLIRFFTIVSPILL